jgi:hypothetical protein
VKDPLFPDANHDRVPPARWERRERVGAEQHFVNLLSSELIMRANVGVRASRETGAPAPQVSTRTRAGERAARSRRYAHRLCRVAAAWVACSCHAPLSTPARSGAVAGRRTAALLERRGRFRIRRRCELHRNEFREDGGNKNALITAFVEPPLHTLHRAGLDLGRQSLNHGVRTKLGDVGRVERVPGENVDVAVAPKEVRVGRVTVRVPLNAAVFRIDPKMLIGMLTICSPLAIAFVVIIFNSVGS